MTETMKCDRCGEAKRTFMVLLLHVVYAELCPHCRTDFEAVFELAPEVSRIAEKRIHYQRAITAGRAYVAICIANEITALHPRLREMVYEWLHGKRVTIELCSACSSKVAR